MLRTLHGAQLREFKRSYKSMELSERAKLLVRLQRLTLNEYLPSTRWVSVETTCHLTV